MPEDLIGSNVSSIEYPVIIRNLSRMVQKDARFSSVELVTISQVDDNLSMEFNLATKIGNEVKKGITL